MWTHLLLGGLVSFVNFGVHALMTGLVVEATRHTAARTDHLHAFLRLTALLTVTMICLMIAHVCEIAIWGAYYDWQAAAPKGTLQIVPVRAGCGRCSPARPSPSVPSPSPTAPFSPSPRR